MNSCLLIIMPFVLVILVLVMMYNDNSDDIEEHFGCASSSCSHTIIRNHFIFRAPPLPLKDGMFTTTLCLKHV